jgi:hypothetical protein
MVRKKRKKLPDDDRSLVEISNDEGDQWVADIPTKGVKETEQSLKDAGAVKDDDEKKVSRRYDAARVVERRDSGQYRYRSARVVNEDEDLEDSHDREGDRSDYEPDVDDEPDSNYEPDSDSERSEQSPVWKFW